MKNKNEKNLQLFSNDINFLFSLPSEKTVDQLVQGDDVSAEQAKVCLHIQ